MATLAHLATNQFIITRLTQVSGYIEAFATVTGIKAHLQPLSAQKTQLYGGAMGKTHIIYCDAYIDILEGDKLRDVNTNQYYVVVNGGSSRRTFGIIDFKQVVVEEVT